jgi:hypothetical protein
MINSKTLGLAVLVMTATACSNESDSDSFTHLSPLGNGQFAVHRHNGPDAVVSANGELTIDGKVVVLDQAQKVLVTRYFAGARSLRDDGIATGMAGASTALTAISSVVSGLANGEPDKIGADVEAKAAKVEASAEKVCVDLRELATTQNALAASLPEFKPYALIDEKEIDECRHG